MIQIENLCFSYPKASKPAVDGVSFDISAGEIFGFLGPNGAGKSTTQRIIIGLLKGYSGRVSVLGKDLSAWRHDYYEHIGVGFEVQNHYLNLTGLENLRFFASLYKKKTRDPLDMLAAVDLKAAADTRVMAYSKGMRMRLNFARALLHDPEILFLDEPNSGLDPASTEHIRSMILAEREKGKTIFLTTHDMNTADRLCDRVAFMVQGKIVLTDTPRRLKLKAGKPLVTVEHKLAGQLKTTEFSLNELSKNQNFFTLLSQGHIESIHTQEATLEKIFIDVTGHNL